MITYRYRPLSGNYRGSVNNQLADYLKIGAGMLELSYDLPAIDSRVTILENKVLGILNTSNFLPNSINGNIIGNNTLNGSKITPGTITGAMIIQNSTSGITDANISSGANISPSKINLSLISHTQLNNIGTNTHATIDADLAQLFGDVGDVPGSGFLVPLTTQLRSVNTGLEICFENLNGLTRYVDPISLATTAQMIGPAINELSVGLSHILGSGFAIAGPAAATPDSIATWGSDNKTLQSSKVNIDRYGNILTSGNLYFSSGNIAPIIGSATVGLQNLYMNGNVLFNNNGIINSPGTVSINSRSIGLDAPVNMNLTGGNVIYMNTNGTIAVAAPSGLFINPGNLGSPSIPVQSGYFNNLYANNIIGNVVLDSSELILTSGTKYLTISSPDMAGDANITTPGNLDIISFGGIIVSGVSSVNLASNLGNFTVSDTYTYYTGTNVSFETTASELSWNGNPASFSTGATSMSYTGSNPGTTVDVLIGGGATGALNVFIPSTDMTGGGTLQLVDGIGEFNVYLGTGGSPTGTRGGGSMEWADGQASFLVNDTDVYFDWPSGTFDINQYGINWTFESCAIVLEPESIIFSSGLTITSNTLTLDNRVREVLLIDGTTEPSGLFIQGPNTILLSAEAVIGTPTSVSRILMTNDGAGNGGIQYGIEGTGEHQWVVQNGSASINNNCAFNISGSDGGIYGTGSGAFQVSYSGASSMGGTSMAIGYGTLTITGGTVTITNASLLQNNVIQQTVTAIGDTSGGGNIGSAAATVDIGSAFNVSQTTAAQTLTLPTPTVTTAGSIAYVVNTGSTPFTMLGKVVTVGVGLTAMWNGASWSCVGFGG